MVGRGKTKKSSYDDGEQKFKHTIFYIYIWAGRKIKV